MKGKAINWKEVEKQKGQVVTALEGADVIKLEKDEHFTGKYIGSEQVQVGDNEPFTSFKFETAKGEQAFSGGMQFATLMRMIEKGSIITVTFKGKKKMSSGYKANQFIVELKEGKINEKEKEKIQKEIQTAMQKKGSKKSKKGGKK